MVLLLYRMYTCNIIGISLSLLIGAFISTSENANLIATGLVKIGELVGTSAWNGSYPDYVMTDDCDAEGRAISQVCNQSTACLYTA